MSSSPIRGVRSWNVKLPPVLKQMVKGVLVPLPRGALMQGVVKKTRKITLEIHENPSSLDESERTTTTALESSKNDAALNPSSQPEIDSFKNQKDRLEEDETVVIRILKPADGGGALEGINTGALLKRAKVPWKKNKNRDQDDDEEKQLSNQQIQWVEHKRFVLDDLVILGRNKNTCEVRLGRGSEQQVRNIIFGTSQELQEFSVDVAHLLKLVRQRATQQLEGLYAGDLDDTIDDETGERSTYRPGSRVKLIVEIVAAYNLPALDVLNKVDPYVKVIMGQDEIHKTKYISKTLNPVWTIREGSTFVFDGPVEDFFLSSGMTFVVRDYDAVSKDDLVGKHTISPKELLQGDGERREYSLCGKDGSSLFGSMIVLKFRMATQKDLAFMAELKLRGSSAYGIHADQVFTPFIVKPTALLKRQSRPRANKSNVTEYRIKPYPDPLNENMTKWSTADEIDAMAMRRSRKWIESGSGDLGKIYFELLKCDGLPNMDTGSKNDCYACIVYEDALVNTEVIMDSNSPRWPSWTQRAFVFNIENPTSQILVGIMDYDPETKLNTQGDPIGRVAVDITNLRPSTEYTLTYNLHRSGYVGGSQRKSVGTITVRLRIQLENVGNLYKRALGLPSPHYVNTVKKYDFEAAYFTVVGKDNIHDLDLRVMASYGKELSGIGNVLIPIIDALKCILLWRGHYPVSIPVFWTCKKKNQQEDAEMGKDNKKKKGTDKKWFTFKLALHSMVAFVSGIFLAENFNLIPAYFFLSISWLLVATSEQNRLHPSPWHQNRSITSLYYSLMSGSISSETIKPNEKKEEGIAFEKERMARALFVESDLNSPQSAVADQLAKEEQDLSNYAVDSQTIATKKTSRLSTINPLKPILLPIQTAMGKVCVLLRITRSTFNWDTCYLSFTIMNVSFLIGLLLIFVPWDFLIRWIMRIIVWVFLGPWMKLVDIFIVRKLEAAANQREKALLTQAESILTAKQSLQILRECALKLKAFKCYLFGEYIVDVPRFKEYRHKDIPLPSSYAVPCKDDEKPNIVAKKEGQYLDIDIVATWGKEARKPKPPKKKPSKNNDAKERGGIVDENKPPNERAPLLAQSNFGGYGGGDGLKLPKQQQEDFVPEEEGVEVELESSEAPDSQQRPLMMQKQAAFRQQIETEMDQMSLPAATGGDLGGQASQHQSFMESGIEVELNEEGDEEEADNKEEGKEVQREEGEKGEENKEVQEEGEQEEGRKEEDDSDAQSRFMLQKQSAFRKDNETGPNQSQTPTAEGEKQTSQPQGEHQGQSNDDEKHSSKSKLFHAPNVHLPKLRKQQEKQHDETSGDTTTSDDSKRIRAPHIHFPKIHKKHHNDEDATALDESSERSQGRRIQFPKLHKKHHDSAGDAGSLDESSEGSHARRIHFPKLHKKHANETSESTDDGTTPDDSKRSRIHFPKLHKKHHDEESTDNDDSRRSHGPRIHLPKLHKQSAALRLPSKHDDDDDKHSGDAATAATSSHRRDDSKQSHEGRGHRLGLQKQSPVRLTEQPGGETHGDSKRPRIHLPKLHKQSAALRLPSKHDDDKHSGDAATTATTSSLRRDDSKQSHEGRGHRLGLQKQSPVRLTEQTGGEMHDQENEDAS